MDSELPAYSAHGDSEDPNLQVTFLAEQQGHGLGESWLPLPAPLLPPQSPSILGGAEMHSGHQHQGRGPFQISRSRALRDWVLYHCCSLCGCLGPCWDRGGRMSPRAAGSSSLGCSSLCTHMRNLSSTLTLPRLRPSPSNDPPLMEVPSPSSFHLHRDSLPSRTQPPPSPVQSSPRDSWLRTSIETRLPARLHTSHRSSCRHVLVARTAERVTERTV